MKRSQLARFGQIYQTQLENLRSHRILVDRLSWGILVPTLALNAITGVLLVMKLHPTESLVPVHYSNLAGGFDRLGPWYQSFSIGIFAVGITLLNTVLAVITFGRSRITSFFLMVGSFVVALFSLVISLALTTGA